MGGSTEANTNAGKRLLRRAGHRANAPGLLVNRKPDSLPQLIEELHSRAKIIENIQETASQLAKPTTDILERHQHFMNYQKKNPIFNDQLKGIGQFKLALLALAFINASIGLLKFINTNDILRIQLDVTIHRTYIQR